MSARDEPPAPFPGVEPGFRSGTVALIGEPNAGKSTLLNRILGTKVAIVSDKPQTTRDRILGILHRPGAQLLFLDTPGMHETEKVLNRFMIRQARAALSECDLAVWVLDAPHEARKFNPVGLLEMFESSGKPVLAALNKVDLIKKPGLLPLMDRLGGLPFVREVYAISALSGEGVEDVVAGMIQALPEGPPYYPEDMVTDRSLRFLAAEIIREKVFEKTLREVPYSTAVLIEQFEEKGGLYVIHAAIAVERDSQKAILIGAQGRMIKSIGEAARKEMERQFGRKIFLDLHVKVEPDWAADPKGLKRMGYA